MLSRLQAHDSTMLENVLAGLFGSEITVGPTFSQQVRNVSSIPDGMILQSAFRFVLETKVQAGLDTHQIERHLDAFMGNDGRSLLMLLMPSKPSEQQHGRIQKQVVLFNQEHDCSVEWVATDFRTLLNLIEGEVDPSEALLSEVLTDFKEYCLETGLLPRHDFQMRAMPVGQTIEENIDLGIYYEPAGRYSSPSKYLGLYTQKAIRAIGEIAKVVVCNVEDGVVHSDSKGELLESESQRIVRMCDLAWEKHGWNIRKGHQFVLVDRFVDTNYEKVSSGGMAGKRYFDLGDVLDSDQLPEIDEMGLLLADETWK